VSPVKRSKKEPKLNITTLNLFSTPFLTPFLNGLKIKLK
jgi:hypothetical protein